MAERATMDRHTQPANAPIAVAGIGTSAGGVEALTSFFSVLPVDLGIAYVVVMHLAPDRDSDLPAILARHTKMPVIQVGDHNKIELEADQVYVIAPNRKLEMTDTSVGASRFEQPRGQRMAIDLFFRSLASEHRDSFAIILSGSGSDGAVGAKAVKEAGGLVLVQDPQEAEYESMPQAVISSGIADVVLPVRELAARLAQLARNKDSVFALLRSASNEDEIDAEVETTRKRVLELLKQRTGHDFSQYKRNTIIRRLTRRMQLAQQASISDYFQYLRENVQETQALLDDFLITVTNFFRDPEAWDALRDRAISPLLESGSEGDPIRAWVPGCATGEEAYSLAILFLEEIERHKIDRDLIIFASDVDGNSLARAREGVYPNAIRTDVSESRLNRFFRAEHDNYRIASSVRERVVFASHSLLRDPPFSRIQLISCRNLLIYLDRDLQSQMMEVFHYACRAQGFLFLGMSETADSDLFQPIDKKHRIFKCQSGKHLRRPLPELLLATSGPAPALRPRFEPDQPLARLHIDTLEALAPPSVIVDEQGNVLHLSESAARFFQQRGGPLARSIIELARPGLRDELHLLLHRVFEGQERQLSDFVPVKFNGSARWVAVLAQLCHPENSAPVALLTFLEAGDVETETVSAEQGTTDELVSSLHEKLRLAEHRNVTLRDDHRLTIEDLRATNEELQSLNEEYRSTTEELETGREELQSINEELQTVNQELKLKLEEVSRANSDLENFIASTAIATVFLDQDLCIKRFTPLLTEIFNIRKYDCGRPLTDFTHNLKYKGLLKDTKRVLSSGKVIERDVASKTERQYIMNLHPYVTESNDVDGVVITFVDVTHLKAVETGLRESEARFRALVDASAQMVWTADANGSVVEDSPSWCSYTGQSEQERKGRGWLDAVDPAGRSKAEQVWRESVEAGSPYRDEYRVYHQADSNYRWTSVRGVPLRQATGPILGWVAMNIDVTDRRNAVEELLQLDQRKDEFLALLGHELRNPLAAIRNRLDALMLQPTSANHSLTVIDRQVQHMHRLINDLLDVARIKQGKLRIHRAPVDLFQCIRDTVDASQNRLEAKQLDLRLDLPEKPIYVNADAERLHQILDNLLRNAIKYTDPEGEIVIRAQRKRKQAMISVRDSGIGIDPDQLAAVFEPYYQAAPDDLGSGLGLGLTLTRHLVKMQDGSITAHSDGRGTGSEFRIKLPVAAEISVPPRTKTAIAEPWRILVVDDQVDVADAFAALLRNLGQDAMVAYSGRGAIEIAGERNPQVAFVDISMPDMDGRDVARHLRKNFTSDDLTLVALTGFADDSNINKGNVFDHYLLKPAELGAVVDLLNSLPKANRQSAQLS
jgi:two-component system CheB/CheR fusion protein